MRQEKLNQKSRILPIPTSKYLQHERTAEIALFAIGVPFLWARKIGCGSQSFSPTCGKHDLDHKINGYWFLEKFSIPAIDLDSITHFIVPNTGVWPDKEESHSENNDRDVFRRFDTEVSIICAIVIELLGINDPEWSCGGELGHSVAAASQASGYQTDHKT